MENLVLACDQAQNRVVVYDLAQYDGVDLDHGELWSFTPGDPSRACLSGAKYRKNTVFGDVVLVVASGGYAGIVKYPSKEIVWEMPACPGNLHSVEILPSGNLIVAASEGATLRLYHTCALRNGDTETANTFKQYSFRNAHGIVWDPKREMLWAEGGTLLRAFTVSGEGTGEELVPVPGAGCDMTQVMGHGLSADVLDADSLFVANTTLYRFDKPTNTLTPFEHNDVMQRNDVKYFGNYPDGSFVLCCPNQGKGTPWENARFRFWCTNVIWFFTPDGKGGYRTTECVSGTCAYYKVLPFVGEYQ